MIYGIGIDIVDAARFKRAMERRGERFLERLFTPEELGYCMRQRFPERHLAARFAAKVSFFKAIGKPMSFRDVEITRDEKGMPRLKAKGIGGWLRCNVSITHDNNLSIAETLVEKIR